MSGVTISDIDILDALNRPIAFQPIFVDVTGSVPGAVFLSQLKYWSERVPDGRDGWFYKTREEWQRETRLTRRNIEVARAHLVQIEILEFEKKGHNNLSWYRVNTNKLRQAIHDILQSKVNQAPQGDLLTQAEIDSLLVKDKPVDKHQKSPEKVDGDGAGHISPTCTRADITNLTAKGLVIYDQASSDKIRLVTSSQAVGTDVTNPLTENTNRSRNLTALDNSQVIAVDDFNPPQEAMNKLSGFLNCDLEGMEIILLEFRLWHRDAFSAPRSYQDWAGLFQGWCKNRVYGLAGEGGS